MIDLHQPNGDNRPILHQRPRVIDFLWRPRLAKIGWLVAASLTTGNEIASNWCYIGKIWNGYNIEKMRLVFSAYTILLVYVFKYLRALFEYTNTQETESCNTFSYYDDYAKATWDINTVEVRLADIYEIRDPANPLNPLHAMRRF